MTTKAITHLLLGCAAALALSACSNPDKVPATADVAVSKNAVDSAASSGAAEFAPAELTAARDKMQRASAALAAKDYSTARDLAQAAQADAKLAQSKANTAKATNATNQLFQDIKVLVEEVERASKP
jgi:hypothetical protein